MPSTDNFLKVGIEAVKKAEKIILEYFSAGVNTGVDFKKKPDNSLVTEADLAAEKAIREVISKSFGDHEFLGEEFGDSHLNSDYVWIIDPIDGTRYFSRGMPFFMTLLSLHFRGKPIVGILNYPAQQKIITAIKDKGTFLNQKQKLEVSKIANLDRAFVSTSSIKYFSDQDQLESLARLNWSVSVLNSLEESRALSKMAQGIIDGWIVGKGFSWDFAAAALVLEEAGAVVSNLHGEKLNFLSTARMSFLATNPILHQKIVPYFS